MLADSTEQSAKVNHGVNLISYHLFLKILKVQDVRKDIRAYNIEDPLSNLLADPALTSKGEKIALMYFRPKGYHGCIHQINQLSPTASWYAADNAIKMGSPSS